MTTAYPSADGNPHRVGSEDVFFFDGPAVVPPPGTMAPPRKERQPPLPPGAVRGWEFVEVGGDDAIVPPPGTMAPPRPPGKERKLRSPAEQPPTEVPALVARIEEALTTIHAALAEIKRLQTPAAPPLPQSKAG